MSRFVPGHGLGLAIVAVSTLPGMKHAPAPARTTILTDGLMETLNIVVLNLILLRWAQRALQRGVWYLAGTIAVEIVYRVARHYGLERESHDVRLATSLFFIHYVWCLYAGMFFVIRSPRPDTSVADAKSLH